MYIKGEQKCKNITKRICSENFEFSQKAALKYLEGRMRPKVPYPWPKITLCFVNKATSPKFC